MKYVELHAASAFSFLQGASVPEEMVAVCAESDMPAMALADLNGFYGAPRFHMAAQKAKVKAHIGAEIIFDFRFLISDLKAGRTQGTASGKGLQSKVKNQKSKIETAVVPVLCASRDGYKNLCELITKMKLR